jgi:hypothetical protein
LVYRTRPATGGHGHKLSGAVLVVPRVGLAVLLARVVHASPVMDSNQLVHAQEQQ